MTDVPMKNAPQLWGWAMASGVAAVAFGAAYVPVGLSSAGAIAVASVLFLIVGLMLGLPARDEAAAAASERVMTPSRMMAAMDAPTKAKVETETAAWVAETEAATAAADVAPEAAHETMAIRPQGLAAARDGRADDLKLIKGIGPKLEVLCNSLGYYHYDQIAAWTPAEVAWVDDNLEGFKGRVSRDDWVAQARALAAGGTPA
ncbi:MAG: NADH:ubiquinone oxidoreductase [Gemmobacter sp.]